MTVIFLIPHVLEANALASLLYTNQVHISAKVFEFTYLMIPHFPFPIQRQRNQTIHFLRHGHRLRRILLLQFKDNLIRLRRHNFRLNRLARLHEFRNACIKSASQHVPLLPHAPTAHMKMEGRGGQLTIPLPRNLIPRIAITPRIIVNRLLGIH